MQRKLETNAHTCPWVIRMTCTLQDVRFMTIDIAIEHMGKTSLTRDARRWNAYGHA